MLNALRKAKAESVKRGQAIMAKAKGESRELTAEEQAAVTAIVAEKNSLTEKISNAEKAEQMGLELEADAVELTQSATRGPRSIPANDDKPVTSGLRANLLDDPKLGYRGKHILGAFAADVFKSGRADMGTSQQWKELAAATGMSQAVGADGGFLVPSEVSNEIHAGMNEGPGPNLLAMTDQYTVTGESLTFTANAETSRARGSQWGGGRAYWIAEAAQITASAPTFRQVRIEPQQLAVLIYATDKLLNNAPALSQYLTRSASDLIRFEAEDAIYQGNGVGKPKGILAAGGPTVSVAKETGQAAATITAKNIWAMWARMHPKAKQNAVWFIATDAFPQLQQLQLAVGTGGVPLYQPPGGLASAPNGTILGRPVVELEYCAALGTTGDILLADMKGYVVGNKGGVASAMSMHLRFDYAETAFRFMYAIDGQPWLKSAITPFNASATQSTFVKLDTRA